MPAIVLAVGVLLGLSVRGQRSVSPRAPLQTLPSRIGAFTGIDRPISDVERRAGGTSDYVLRAFSDGEGQTFSVYVGYYARQARGQTIHSPKNCLPGDGWETMTAGTVTVPTAGRNAVVNRVILAKGATRALVYYWYQGRGRVVANEYVVKWNLLRDAAVSRRTEEALVRIVIMLDEPGLIGTGAAIARADIAAGAAVGVLVPAVEGVLPPAPGVEERTRIVALTR
jgi:EpsI family protein